MSRLLLVNFEDFGLNEEITETIKPFNSFCICCLDREGPMFDLEKCEHSDYLDAFDTPEPKLYNQLVCVQCHSILKKIKHFQKQILESNEILLSGTFTELTINNKRLNRLSIQKVVDDLHLPCDIPNDNLMEDAELPNICIEDNFNDVIQNNSLEDNFNSDISNMLNEDNLINEQNLIQEESLILEQDFIQEQNSVQENLIEEQNLIQEPSLTEGGLNQEQNLIEQNLILEQKVNKNIKTALEILERNSQNFGSLSSQLQLLDGEDLTSLLGTSLLSKEILTDMPLVPAETLTTDLDNGLLNNSKSLGIEMEGTDKMFYDNLGISPDLEKETKIPETIEFPDQIEKEIKPKTKPCVKEKHIKEKKSKKKALPAQLRIRRVKLSHDELNRERVLEAQSRDYLKFKFRCETCIIGFNYKLNLDDHIKRKHQPINADSMNGVDNIICEICSQVIPNKGSVTEHNYRHYTRYDCMRCSRRFRSHDEALRHYARNKCANNSPIKKR